MLSLSNKNNDENADTVYISGHSVQQVFVELAKVKCFFCILKCVKPSKLSKKLNKSLTQKVKMKIANMLPTKLDKDAIIHCLNRFNDWAAKVYHIRNSASKWLINYKTMPQYG